MNKEIFSQEYENLINSYKKMHQEGTQYDDAKNTFDGKSLRFFFNSIKKIIEATKSDSLIDYGCGKAKYYFNSIEVNNNTYKNIIDYWKIKNYYLYDPGVSKFSKYPSQKADGVICVDVVEHIPEEDVYNFIKEIFNLANKFIFIVIACYPANKTFPNGRNVHVCIKTPDEWRKILSDIKSNYNNISPVVICTTARKKFTIIT